VIHEYPLLMRRMVGVEVGEKQRLWHGKNGSDEAHDLLTPVYDWFTEGFDTADLKDAKALLEELG